MPLGARHRRDTLAGTGPSDYRLVLVIVMDQRPGSRRIVIAFRFPRSDESVERNGGNRKEQLDVLIGVIPVSLRKRLSESKPMARLSGRTRPVAHEFHDSLLFKR